VLVKAECLAPAWEYPVYYRPGRGPLPGGLYEIEHNGKLALMQVRGNWVFQFDREATAKATSATPAGEPPPSSGDGTNPAPAAPAPFRFPVEYKCKKCGEVFSTVNALGTHCRKESHTADDIAAELASVSASE